MASLVMSTNMNNVCVTSTKSMHPCKVCNKELDNEKALWLHMRTHGIHHYYSDHHPSYLDQRRKVVSALPSRLQSTLKDGFQDPKDPNMANCLVLLSNGTLKPLAVVLMESSGDGIRDLHASDPEPIRVEDQSMEFHGKGKFECKACNKVFTSHQALGGHRASHKKVKGCFAANVVASNFENDENDCEPALEVEKITPDERVLAPKKSNKSHECSICHKVFPSGQALGGHKRCHWLPYTIPPPPPPPPQTTNITSSPQPLKFHNFLNVDESRPLNTGSHKKPRYTIISSPPHPNPYPSVPPKLGFTLDISGGINASSSTVTFLGPMSKNMKPSSNFFQSRHCSYKCNTTLSLFNDEDQMPSKIQWEGKSSSWLHLGITSSTSSEETA